MTDDKRMIAVSIGVANSVPKKYLAGAINGAREFDKWASSQGYETILVTDENGGEVTIGELRKKIEGLLGASANPIHRILVYFAGHGLIRELEEGLWLLSDWRKELRAVAYEVLKRRFSMYRPKQICIISDACRSLPADIEQADLVADSVLGTGPNLIDTTVPIDRFIATQDGAEAFHIPGEDPDEDRCLFSGVLIEGLWGQPGRSEQPFSALVPDKVTGRSLAKYLAAEVLGRAKDYELTITPTFNATFPEGDDYYFTKGAPSEVPRFAPWPPKQNLAAAKTAAAEKPGDFETEMVREIPRGRPRPTLSSHLNRLMRQVQPGLTNSGLVIDKGAIRVWSKSNVAVQAVKKDQIWTVTDEASPLLSASAPLLIELSNGLFVAAVVMPKLFTCVARDDFGATGIVYRDPYAPAGDERPLEEALMALERGSVRSGVASDLAVKLRRMKHVDPVLGVLSAYLYEPMDDIDNIRRMASYYIESGQAIPYDIALLGGLHLASTDGGLTAKVPEVGARQPRTEGERSAIWTHEPTEARSGAVGGFWPWMRQGWAFMDHLIGAGTELDTAELVRIRAGLTRSRFTTFREPMARRLIEIYGFVQSDIV